MKIVGLTFKYLFLAAVCVIALCGFFISSEIISPLVIQHRYIHIDIFLILVAFILLVTLVICSKQCKSYKGIILLLIIHFLFGVFFIVTFKITPIADSKSIIDCATELFNNPSNFIHSLDTVGSYLSVYPFQYGMVKLCYLCIQLFGVDNVVISMQSLNLLMYMIMLIYLLKINRTFQNYSIKYDYYLLILLLIWFVPITYVTYVYGFNYGLALSVVSIYYYLQFLNKKSFKYVIISLFVLIIACALKLNYLIIFVAYIFDYLIKTSEKKLYKAIVLASFIIAMLFANNICKLMFYVDYNYSLKQSVSMSSYLVMGGVRDQHSYTMGQDPIAGWHDGYNINVLVENNGNQEVINNQVNNDLKNMISLIVHDPMYSLNYYMEKFISTWTIKDFQSKYYLTNEGDTSLSYNDIVISLNHGLLNYIYEFTCRIGYYLIVGLLLWSAWISIKKKDSTYLLFQLMFLGGFGYYLLFETKAIYVYPFIVLTMPVIIDSLSYLTFDSIAITKSKVIYLLIFVIVCLLFNGNQKIIINSFDNRKDKIFPLISQNYESIEFDLEPTHERIYSIEVMSSGHLDYDTIVDVKIVQRGNIIYSTAVNYLDFIWNDDYLTIDLKNESIVNDNLSMSIQIIGKNSEGFNIIGFNDQDQSIIVDGYEVNNNLCYRINSIVTGNDLYHNNQLPRIRIFG